jgi:signal transduction histidine kinase
MRWLWFIWLGCLVPRWAGARVQAAVADTLRLEAVNYGPWNPYLAYCLDPCAQPSTGLRAASLWAAGRFRPVPPGRVLQAGFTQDRLWLRATVVNTLPQRTRFVWSVYEFVDSATLYMQPRGRGLPRRVVGTSGRVVADQRPFPSRAACLPFWLEAHASAVLYLSIENHSGSLYIPTDITTTEDFLAYEQGFIVVKNWTWLLGLYFSSALFNLLLFAFLRDRIHLWYGAYVFFITWFLMMEDGLDSVVLPQAMYSLGWQVGQYSLLLLALGCGVRIMTIFLRLRQAWPRLYRLSWVLSGLAAGYALGYAVLAGSLLHAAHASRHLELAWLNAGREALLWGILVTSVFIIGAVWYRGRAPHRRLAALYGLTYLFFCGGSVNFMLNRTGLVNIHLIDPNALAWGLALELFTLSALLTGRFRYTLRQNAEMRVRQLRERELAGRRLITAQEEEREALARELHDALAPSLTALHLAWQGRQVRQALSQAPAVLTDTHEQTEALLRQVRHDVRTLSQGMLPILHGEPPPLPEAVALLTETLGLADTGPRVHCYCDAATAILPLPVQQAAYRIVAELLHNALRHAQAAEVWVEVRRLPTSLRIAVADNGCGFDPHAAPSRRGGLGLRGVRARAGYLRGQVLVHTQPGQGASIVVEIPV